MVWAGGEVDGNSSSDHVELTISDQSFPLHNKNTSRDNIRMSPVCSRRPWKSF